MVPKRAVVIATSSASQPAGSIGGMGSFSRMPEKEGVGEAAEDEDRVRLGPCVEVD